MRPSFNSRGNAFVVCHVTWRFLKTGEMYPRENNETFISFLFTSFHFAALPHPISFRDPDQAAPRLAHIPGGASRLTVSPNITTRDRAWHARSSFRKCWDERKRNRTWIFKAFVNFGRFLSRNRKLMDSLNEFANILYTDFPSIFWRLVFLYGQREREEKRSSRANYDTINASLRRNLKENFFFSIVKKWYKRTRYNLFYLRHLTFSIRLYCKYINVYIHIMGRQF